jgi:hypothetical protein
MMNDPTRHDTLADVLAACVAAPKPSERFRFMSSPLLAALGRAGTTHLYVDTADVDEVRAVAPRGRPGADRDRRQYRQTSRSSAGCSHAVRLAMRSPAARTRYVVGGRG